MHPILVDLCLKYYVTDVNHPGMKLAQVNKLNEYQINFKINASIFLDTKISSIEIR